APQQLPINFLILPPGRATSLSDDTYPVSFALGDLAFTLSFRPKLVKGQRSLHSLLPLIRSKAAPDAVFL
ncbi:MAG: hypothetical protein ABI158_02170, partial [Edaphobacter sp.]